MSISFKGGRNRVTSGKRADSRGIRQHQRTEHTLHGVAEWLCEKVDAVAVSGASVAEGQGGQSTITAQEQREV